MEESVARISEEDAWNSETFREAYGMYYRVMVKYAMNFVRIQEEAEDIVQETFVRLWIKRDTTYGDDAFVKMLHVSVRNRCLDFLKHQAVERAYTSGAALETEESLEESIFAAEIYARLFKEIDQLPHRQRETMRLVCEGKTNAEIADVMSVGIETVKNQKHKALVSLKKAFGEHTLMLLACMMAID